MKKGSWPRTIFTALLLAVFLLTAAVAVPLLWRGFYYGQIEPLNLVARSGFSPAVIREAFDQVMDYLVFGKPYGTGQLRSSAEGMAHFADCQFLFRLDFIVAAVTGVILLILLIRAFSSPAFRRKFAFSVPLLSLFILGGVLLVLGVWAFVDFTSLFTLFHRIAFPGRSNWMFDYRLDQIILILPEDFWVRVAALVAALALGGAALLAVLHGLFHLKWKPKSVYEELIGME